VFPTERIDNIYDRKERVRMKRKILRKIVAKYSEPEIL